MGLAGLIWLMTGCSNEEEEPALRQIEVPVGEVSSFATYFDEHVAMTRAWTPPTGFSAYEGDEQTIGIAFTQNGQEPIKGTFFKSGEKWQLKVLAPPEKKEEDITSDDYYLYGYIPNTASVNLIVTDRSGANTSFSSGAKMVLENVPTVMGKDLCVVVGAKNGTDKETVTGLSRGDFKFHAEPTSKESPKNFVFLLFDHLYSALHIKMKVDADYAKVRTIKLRSLQLTTQNGEAITSKEKTTITIDLKANDAGSDPIQSDAGSDPIQSVSYEQSGNDIDAEGMSFWSSSTGEELTTEYKDFSGHFMPIGITKLVLTSVYDVYDKKENRIREGCKAINTMEFGELWTGQTETIRGYRYTLNMTVTPTYLYVLSDPDLDNPTVTVSH